MLKQNETMIAADGTPIYYQTWEDETRSCRGLLQIVHGYAEWVDRYDEFACYMASQGFFVFGEDHRGHGQTQQRTDRLIHFAESDGFELVVNDNHMLLEHIRDVHPGIPVFLFGHSMGSFLARRYIQLYGDEFAGVILSGTGNNPAAALKFGHALAVTHVRTHGAEFPDPYLNAMVFGQLNRGFHGSKTGLDWICRRASVINGFFRDERRGTLATAGFFRDFIDGMLKTQNPTLIAQAPKNLPVLYVSGQADPVGGRNASGVRAARKAMLNAGMTDVSIHIYPGARHEILNETNRAEVSRDILNWINLHI